MLHSMHQRNIALKAKDESMCWDVNISNDNLHIGKRWIVKHSASMFSTRKTVESTTQCEAFSPNSPRKSLVFPSCRNCKRSSKETSHFAPSSLMVEPLFLGFEKEFLRAQATVVSNRASLALHDAWLFLEETAVGVFPALPVVQDLWALFCAALNIDNSAVILCRIS